MDNLYDRWRSKLIGTTTDGENTMTGRHGGVVTLIEREAEHDILRVWCGPHQIDLSAKHFIKDLNNGSFYKMTHALSVHLRKQANLITTMQSTCPKDTTRWAQFAAMTAWLLTHRLRLLKHIEEKDPACAPTNEWWLICAAVCPVLRCISTTLVILQGNDIILSQQMTEIERLIHNISTMLNITNEADFDYDEVGPDELFVSQGLCILPTDAEAHVKDQGSWARNLLAAFSVNAKNELLSMISKAVIQLVASLTTIRAERDSNNNARGEVAPPVMPFPLAQMRTSTFIDTILDKYRARLLLEWQADEVEMIETDHQELVHAYRHEPGFKERVDKQDHTTMFNHGWGEFAGRFTYLRQFSAGLGCVFANTATVESDFSVLKWEMDDFRSSMSNITLEGVFQSKQTEIIAKLGH
jgi:hypothetical protein